MPARSPEHGSPEFDSIEDCIEAFRNGEFIIVLDSASRENEGDLIIAAEDMTPEKMAFMVRFSSGIICAPLTESLAKSLSLPYMIPPTANADPNGTAYTVTIDGSHPSITTGISAADRSLTCNLLAGSDSNSQSFRRPGHILPLIAKEGGIRERRGHTEAAVEFCRLARKTANVGVISEIVEELQIIEPGQGITQSNGNGQSRPIGPRFVGGTSMMRRDGCLEFGRRWNLKCCTVEDLVEYVEKEHSVTANGKKHSETD